MTLDEAKVAAGFATDVVLDIIPDGRWRRCNTLDSKSKNGAYRTEPSVHGGTFTVLKNHSTGECARWWSREGRLGVLYSLPSDPLSPEVDYFSRTRTLWEALPEDSGVDSPYLQEKLARPYRMARYSTKYGVTLVPIEGATGEMVAIQRIANDGEKRIHGRGGLFCRIFGHPSRTALVEGFATGSSVREITGFTVLVCFSTGGLLKVARWMVDNGISADVYVFADNDVRTRQRTGTNSGIVAATEAASLVDGTVVPCPIHGDWNDLFVRYGLDAARIHALRGLEVAHA